MALVDDVRALVAAGAQEYEVKQAFRQIMDEKQLADHAATLPNIPAVGPVVWAKLKARLLSADGPNNVYEMLVRLHNALDADNQPAFWAALFGLVKAVWHQHPGHRRDTVRPTL